MKTVDKCLPLFGETMICRCIGTVITDFGGSTIDVGVITGCCCCCCCVGAVSSISISSSSSNDAANLAYKFAALDDDLAFFLSLSFSMIFDRLANGSSHVGFAFESILRLLLTSPETLNGGSDDFRSSKSASILFAVTTCECLPPPITTSLPSSSINFVIGADNPSKPANALSASS